MKQKSLNKLSKIKAQIFIIILMICVCVLLFASCKRYISYDDAYDIDLEEGCSDFYYRQLSENQQKMYRMIYKEAQEVMRGGSKSDLGVYKYSDYNLTKQDALTVWDAFYFDTPAFFFMSNLYDNDDNSIKVKIFKEFSKKSARDKIFSSLKKTVADVEQLLEGIDKEAFRFKAIYDYVMASTKYKEAEGYDLFDGYSCSIASVFDFDDSTDTICQGYAKAISYLCNVFGIECIFVSSESRNHTLNIVKIEGNWYYADSTFDDNGRHFYEFFLKGNDETWQGTIYPGNDKSERFLISTLPELDKQEYKLELDGVQYAISSPTSYAVIGVLDSARSVVIPTAIGDMQVNEIKSNAFAGRWNLHSLTIPKGIKVNSFAINFGCKNLTVFCKDSERPENWAEDWTIDSRPVIWDCKDSGITQEGIVWGLTNDDEMLVTGYGGSAKDAVIPRTVNGYEVKNICANAFRDNIVLAGVTIPDSIEVIGKDAFAGCDGMIIYCEVGSKPSGWDDNWNSDNRPVIWNCKSFGVTQDGIKWTMTDDGEMTVVGYAGSSDDIVIPEIINERPVTAIGASAFENLDKLSTILIPSGVTSIGEKAFWGCDSLNIYFTAYNMQNELYFNIREFRPAVWNCSKEYGITQDGIKWVLTNDNVITIAGYCGNSEDITLPETINTHSVGDICEYAFYRSNLKGVTIPESITNFNKYAFRECANLTLYFQSEKPYDWFLKAISFVPIVFNCQEHGVTADGIRWGLTKDGDITFAGYEGDSADVVIPETVNGRAVTSVCEYAFWHKRQDIKSVKIPDSVKYIGHHAFYGCDELENIELSNSLISIESQAFYYCSNLIVIVIPNSVVSIDGYVFGECNNLTIYCEAESQPSGWNSNWNKSYNGDTIPVVWGYIASEQ